MGLLLTLAAPAQAQEIPNARDKQDIPHIAAMMGSENRQERNAAFLRLNDFGQSAMPGLVRIRKSGTIEQRRGAIIGLAFMPIPELTTKGLIDALGDQDAVVRSLAAHALAKVGVTAAPEIAKMLANSNPQIRTGAALALTQMKKDAVPALSLALSTKDGLVRAKTAWLLGRMGPDAQAAIPALIRALKTTDMRVMHVVGEAIDLIGASPGLLTHELLLLGYKPGLFPLKHLGARAAPTLTALLSRPGTPLGHAAMLTLARIGMDAKPALLHGLRTGNASQKTAAALLLSDIDPKTVLILPEDIRQSLSGARHDQ